MRREEMVTVCVTTCSVPSSINSSCVTSSMSFEMALINTVPLALIGTLQASSLSTSDLYICLFPWPRQTSILPLFPPTNQRIHSKCCFLVLVTVLERESESQRRTSPPLHPFELLQVLQFVPLESMVLSSPAQVLQQCWCCSW